MKNLIYIFALIWATAWAYEFKHVQAQAQSVNPLQIDDAQMLENMGQTSGFIDSKRVWGADIQARYYWKSGVPTGVRTAEYISKHTVIICKPEGQGKGYYTTIRYLIPIDNVVGADSALTAWGYVKGTAYNIRIVNDSLRLNAEVSRAITQENLKSNLTYANSLSARQTADSLRLVNEVNRATNSESSKLSVTDAANTYQAKGTYVVTETDPLYTANGATKAYANSISLRLATDSARDVNKVQTVTAGLNGGIVIGGTTQNPMVSQVTPTYNNAPARTLGTSYQISTTRPTRVSYTISILTTLSLLNLNSSGVVYLEISPNNSTWTTVNSAGITRTLSVSITVGLNDTSLFNVQAEVPVGYYVRLRSVISGGATATFMSGQEVTY